MSLLDLLLGRRENTAATARYRLQIIIAQKRVQSQAPDYWAMLKKELIEVLARYVNIWPDDIRISQEQHDGLEMLQFNIPLPEPKKEKVST